MLSKEPQEIKIISSRNEKELALFLYNLLIIYYIKDESGLAIVAS